MDGFWLLYIGIKIKNREEGGNMNGINLTAVGEMVLLRFDSHSRLNVRVVVYNLFDLVRFALRRLRLLDSRSPNLGLITSNDSQTDFTQDPLTSVSHVILCDSFTS